MLRTAWCRRAASSWSAQTSALPSRHAAMAALRRARALPGSTPSTQGPASWTVTTVAPSRSFSSTSQTQTSRCGIHAGYAWASAQCRACRVPGPGKLARAALAFLVGADQHEPCMHSSRLQGASPPIACTILKGKWGTAATFPDQLRCAAGNVQIKQSNCAHC